MKKHALIIGDVNSLENYLDFEVYSYSIVTSEYEYQNMRNSIKALLFGICIIKTPSALDACCFEKQMDTLLAGVNRIRQQQGTIDCVISTHEHTVLPAAIIRKTFHIKGLSYEEALKVRNKHVMKQCIEKANIKIPHYLIYNQETPASRLSAFLLKNKYVYVKPVNQAGSSNILGSDDEQAIRIHINKLLKANEEIIIEEAIDGTVMHFDGIAIGGKVKFLSVSEKMGNCYDYVQLRKPLTTIISNEKAIYKAANSYVNKCLQALQIINNMVFHLEVFFKQRTNEFIFLEIAGRYPGSGITGLIESVFNIDLVKMSYAIDCLNFTLEDIQGAVLPDDIHNSVGRVLIPTPLKKDLRVKAIKGLDKVPNTIIRSTITGPGNRVLFDPIDAFQRVCEFTIADRTKEQVIQSVNRLNKTIQFTYEEV